MQVAFVDENGIEIGQTSVIDAHLGEAKRHRAASVFLFSDSGKMLMQQRAKQKIVGGELWSNTICGNARPSESSEACAHRRLREELGIEGVVLEQVDSFEYRVPCDAFFSEWEFDTAFIGTYSAEPTPNPQEVMGWEYLSFDVIQKQLEDYPEKFSPWFRVFIKRPKILEMFHAVSRQIVEKE
ncbi:MAG: hypothetical protein A2378_03450 [Candidatus Pacebacteria bacterium RIFOXYB1_FULL_44_10]|nr:MAG: hypothetical protein A2378_03450 [Candidatus Pacebacteria bacterium RIFOXYB1_FULL_44_10]